MLLLRFNQGVAFLKYVSIEKLVFTWVDIISSPEPESSVHNVQTSSPLKSLGQSKPNSCGASLGRGNESLYKWSRSHDQDGRLPMYGKNLKNLLWDQKSYDLETWHAVLGT